TTAAAGQDWRQLEGAVGGPGGPGSEQEGGTVTVIETDELAKRGGGSYAFPGLIDSMVAIASRSSHPPPPERRSALGSEQPDDEGGRTRRPPAEWQMLPSQAPGLLERYPNPGLCWVPMPRVSKASLGRMGERLLSYARVQAVGLQIPHFVESCG